MQQLSQISAVSCFLVASASELRGSLSSADAETNTSFAIAEQSSGADPTVPACADQPNFEMAKVWCGTQTERFACFKDAAAHNPVWDCRVESKDMCSHPCLWSSEHASKDADGFLPLVPSCDDRNVGSPNCPGDARCNGEYRSSGNLHILKASSTSCAYTTFKTQLVLSDVKQMDVEVFITPNTCSPLDNLAFWFFQATEFGQTVAEQSWSSQSEVDLFETYIGPGAVNSVNTNFAGHGLAAAWEGFSITGGMHQHVTMWQDMGNVQGCPETEVLPNGRVMQVVSIFIAHCRPGEACCVGDSCAALQASSHVARSCVTVQDAPILMVLSNWGSGHRVTPGCEIGIAHLKVDRK